VERVLLGLDDPTLLPVPDWPEGLADYHERARRGRDAFHTLLLPALRPARCRMPLVAENLVERAADLYGLYVRALEAIILGEPRRWEVGHELFCDCYEALRTHLEAPDEFVETLGQWYEEMSTALRECLPDLQTTPAETSEGKPMNEGQPTPPVAEVAPTATDALSSSALETLRAVERKLSDDRFREQQVERLYAELEAHRKGLVDQLMRPLVDGIIGLHEDAARAVADLRNEPPEALTPERFLAWVEGVRSDMESLLDDVGYVRFVEPSPSFNPQRQTAVRSVPTGDPALVGQVAERVRPGFECGGRVVHKERVVVYVAATPTGDPAGAPPRTNQGDQS
jgi:molecular chaperone GrpE (heat shock protein)